MPNGMLGSVSDLDSELISQLEEIWLQKEDINFSSLLSLLQFEVGSKSSDNMVLELLPDAENPSVKNFNFYYKNPIFTSLKKFHVKRPTLIEVFARQVVYLKENGVI